MDMLWFDDVLALLEERNMTRAAGRRNITQPAFSRRIRSFEDWLGVDVLDRQVNRIEISPALVASEMEIRALVTQLNELRTKIAHYDPATSVISIAAPHASLYSTFPDMALRARAAYQGARFRIRAANLSDCVSLFLRGDTNLLLCYEARSVGAMQFGANVRRGFWGQDYLIPVVGGVLRSAVKDDGDLPLDTPAIVYPDNSYFGEVLSKTQRRFGTSDFCANPVCQTAFSSGAKEMILNGLGVGWMPFSMVHREIENGDLISLSNRFGKETLDVAIYAHRGEGLAEDLVNFWTSTAPAKP